jgi:hypothetical protein
LASKISSINAICRTPLMDVIKGLACSKTAAATSALFSKGWRLGTLAGKLPFACAGSLVASAMRLKRNNTLGEVTHAQPPAQHATGSNSKLPSCGHSMPVALDALDPAVSLGRLPKSARRVLAFSACPSCIQFCAASFKQPFKADSGTWG